MLQPSPNMAEYLEWLDLSDTLFVLDRGFFSSYNLKKMNANMRFIIPLPYTNKNSGNSDQEAQEQFSAAFQRFSPEQTDHIWRYEPD